MDNGQQASRQAPGKTQLPRSSRSSSLSLSASYSSSRVLDAILRDVANVNGIFWLFWPMLVNRKPGERPKRIALADLVTLCGSPACVVCSHTQMIPASQFASNELTNYISLAAFFSRLNGPERAPGTILIIIAGVPNYKNTTKLRTTRQPQLGPLMLVKLIST